MPSLPYEIVDVFTDRPFAGNPLAIVFDGVALQTEQMQALAREFHLSETVFALPTTVAEATYRARIFTPDAELPFAGHPSVGLSVTLMRRGEFAAGVVRQECGAGILPIEVAASGRATLTGGTPSLGPPLDPLPLLAAVGLSADDADTDTAPPRRASCGLEFIFLPVRPGAVARAQPGRLDPAVGDVAVFAWDPATRRSHTRVFVPSLGVAEDPATGSAALGLGVWLVAAGLLPGDESSSYVISQGTEVERPSTLECSVLASGGTATVVTVSGAVVPVARGEIAIPPPAQPLPPRPTPSI